MIIGVFSLELHLPDSRSLKNRRQVLRRLKDRLRSRHNVAVMELGDYGDVWQRGGLLVVSVATHRDALERLFEAVRREAEADVPGHVIETGSEFIEGTDVGPGA